MHIHYIKTKMIYCTITITNRHDTLSNVNGACCKSLKFHCIETGEIANHKNMNTKVKIISKWILT